MFWNSFDVVMGRMDAIDPPILPSLSTCSRLFVASDYSGQHRGSPYETYSFLLASADSLPAWQRLRAEHRRRHDHGRTYSYKRLSDAVRLRSLSDFLRAADALEGVLVTVGVNTAINSLFTYDKKLLSSSPRYDNYQYWSATSFERVARLTSIVTFFLAGLAPILDHLHWVSDNDETLSNEQHVEDFLLFLGQTCDAFYKRRLATVEVKPISTESDQLRAEDLVAPADLAAGGIADFLARAPDVSHIHLPAPDLSEKASLILRWLSLTDGPLKRLVFALEPIPSGKSFRIRHIQLGPIYT